VTKNARQLAILGVLIVVLVAVVVTRGGGSEPVSTVPAASASAPQAALGAVPAMGLRLDRLNTSDGELDPVVRDPFRFAARPAPVAQSHTVVRRAEPVVSAPMAPTGPPPPPPIPLKFIGVLDAPARVGRLAVLSDSRGGVFYGKEGDTIEGRYRVLRVSAETAELAYLDGRGRQTIRLSGQ
jgi:hypothetical protein